MTHKRCLRDPIPEIYDAARYLDAAVSAHLNDYRELAEKLFAVANDKNVLAWTDSIWGKNSKYVVVTQVSAPPSGQKSIARMPTSAQKLQLHERDGYHCRYCGIPVIRKEIRKALHLLYPDAITWGKTNASQHAAFQCMWAQYDHVVPHSSGGSNELDNLVVACAACNFGKMNYTLEELMLADPRHFAKVESQWDGLERAVKQSK